MNWVTLTLHSYNRREAWHSAHSAFWTGTDQDLKSEVLGSTCSPAINYVLMSLGCYSNPRHLRVKAISASCSLGETEGTHEIHVKSSSIQRIQFSIPDQYPC
jgi:hypothetical protein